VVFRSRNSTNLHQAPFGLAERLVDIGGVSLRETSLISRWFMNLAKQNNICEEGTG